MLEKIELVDPETYPPMKVPPRNVRAFPPVLLTFMDLLMEVFDERQVPDPREAALNVAEQVRRYWSGIQIYLPRVGYKNLPRFLEEVEVWVERQLRQQWKGSAGAWLSKQVAGQAVTRVWEVFGSHGGGEAIYIGQDEPMLMRRIALTLCDSNVVDLVRETGLTQRHLYRIRQRLLPELRALAREQRAQMPLQHAS